MTRSEARQILRARRGAVQRLAEDLSKSGQSVFDVIDGKRKSAPILAAAILRAKQIVAAEAKAAAEERESEPLLCA